MGTLRHLPGTQSQFSASRSARMVVLVTVVRRDQRQWDAGTGLQVDALRPPFCRGLLPSTVRTGNGSHRRASTAPSGCGGRRWEDVATARPHGDHRLRVHPDGAGLLSRRDLSVLGTTPCGSGTWTPVDLAGPVTTLTTPRSPIAQRSLAGRELGQHLRLWDAVTGESATLPHNHHVLTWPQSEGNLATGCAAKTARIWTRC